ncbi:PIN domain-containing protein [Paenirhodobacter populi]|uniref:Type II toxin-antitoxin system VapC family toxin n=1 Tax=Paenirhodobacter populi TaxID=2306993 RepID=A0A443IVS8_9RHOB|nr:hypothetical protein [Sinirhodobacter populi]RWR12242.1 hypothetical protein D2T33_09045 [Sinirhodobacter populi]RWR28178.1 hypothetical protein D2T31_14125 [Sinirhodobacter populi]
MYFDGTTLITLLADPDRAAAALVGAHRRFTSPLAVIEVLAARPDAGVTEFLDAQGIELRDMPPAHRLVEFAQAEGGADVGRLLHGACAAYYEAEVFVLPPQV